MKLLEFLVVGFACTAVAFGQATVEYSVGTGAATGAAAGAKGAGQAVGGVFGAVGQILNQAPKPGTPPAAASSTTAAPTSTPAAPVSVPAKPIDPSQVAVGMDRNELLERFGEPATRTSQTRRSQMLDTFWYQTITKDELIVSLTDGKVVSTVLASQRRRNSVASTKK